MSEQFQAPELNQKPMSSFEQLYQIVINPGKVFDSIVLKSNIIVPLLFCFAVAGIQMLVLSGDMASQISETLKNLPQMKEANLEPQQLANLIDIQVKVGIASALVIAAVSPLIGGAIAHLISMFMGGEGTFSESCSVTANGAVIYALGMILALPFAYLTHDYTFSFSANVFMAKDAMSPMYSLLSFVNVFFIWQMVVTTMGFKKIHQFGMIKAAIAVLIPTLITILMAVVPLLTMK